MNDKIKLILVGNSKSRKNINNNSIYREEFY